MSCFVLHLKKILFSPLSTILFFLYYDVIFYFTKINFLGDTEKFKSLGLLRSTQNLKFFGHLLKISFGGDGCIKKVDYLP